MREDMAQVIVERPRIRDRGAGRRGRARPLEELPSHEGMRRPHRLSKRWKELNENLSPLRRFLEAQVGRPWNKVYSEIAARLRVDSTVQQHVRDHIGDFVALDPRPQVRWVYRRGGQWKRIEWLWYQPLYVDPRDGILKRTARHPLAKAERRLEAGRPVAPPDRIALDDGREVRRVAGIWYEVQLAPLPEPIDFRLAPADRFYVVKKRQLSRAELRRIGLQNEVAVD
jgi:hypothetical protein